MPNFKKLTALFIIIFSLTYFMPVYGQVFVKLDASGANNGTSWKDAYNNLDSAIHKTSSGQVWVATGVYKPSVTFSYHSYPAFNIEKNISLFGGFNGTEHSLDQRNIQKNITTLSGDIGIADYDLDNTPTVIAITGAAIDSSCVIDGFTITKAYYREYANFPYLNGALYIYTGVNGTRGTPIIRNCIITENFGFLGGGINIGIAKPRIVDNIITNNTAFNGAGIYLDNAADACIIGNKITNNKCVGGYSNLSGGGIQIGGQCAPFIIGNLIDNNFAGHYGGGIGVANGNEVVTITNNIISNNTSNDGGGISVDFTATKIINNLITGNKAKDNGGAMYIDYSAKSSSINNTIVGNSADNFGGAVYLKDGNMEFINDIIFNNPTKNNTQFNSFNLNRTDWFPKLRFCNLQGGKQGITFRDPSRLDYIWQTGSIGVYPAFADTANSNYHLLPGSVCIDKGTPDTAGLLLPSKDISLRPRVLNKRIDMGCYEYDSSFVSSDSLTVSPSIVNLEGYKDSTFALTISSNQSWTISSKPDWIIADSTNNSSPEKLFFTAKANPELNAERIGKIIFSRQGIVAPVTALIKQSRAAFLHVSPDTIYVGSRQNDSAVFNIFSNLGWYFSNYPEWISFSNVRSVGNASIQAMANSNDGFYSRWTQVNIASLDYIVDPPATHLLTIIQLSPYLLLCQNGSDSVTAGIKGNSYQWQVDTGDGFSNLSNNAYYSGTNSNYLKLFNIPSSFNGRKYRCLIDKTSGNVYTLKIQNSWIGYVDNQWENPLNWSCSVLPDKNTDVLINSGTVFVNTNTSVGSLKIMPAAKVVITKDAHLTISH